MFDITLQLIDAPNVGWQTLMQSGTSTNLKHKYYIYRVTRNNVNIEL